MRSLTWLVGVGMLVGAPFVGCSVTGRIPTDGTSAGGEGGGTSSGQRPGETSDGPRETSSSTTEDEDSSSGDGDATGDTSDSTNGDGDGSSDTSDPEECFVEDEECTPFTNCREGEFVEVEGSESQDRVCGVCQAGSYSEGQNASECEPCPEGSFSDSDGAASCSDWSICHWYETVITEGSAAHDYDCADGPAYREFDTPGRDDLVDLELDASGSVFVALHTTASPPTLETDSCPSLCRRIGLIVKYDRLGNPIETYAIAPGTDVTLTDLTLDSSGNVLVVGYDSGGVTPAQGGLDAFLIKLSGDLRLLWNRGIGTTEDDRAQGVTTDESGHVYVVGGTRGALDGPGSALGNEDMFLRVYGSNGSTLSTHQLGGDGFERAAAVEVNESGQVYLIGSTQTQPFYGQQFPNSNATEAAVVVLVDTQDESVLPQARVMTFGERLVSRGEALVFDGEGGYYLAGRAELSATGWVYLGRFDADGDLLWSDWTVFEGGFTPGLGGLTLDESGQILLAYTSDRRSAQTGTSESYVVVLDDEGVPQAEIVLSTDRSGAVRGDSVHGLASSEGGRLFSGFTSTGLLSSADEAQGGLSVILLELQPDEFIPIN